MGAGDSIQGFNKKALREIQDAIDKLPKEFTVRRVQGVLKKGLQPFIRRARLTAPIDTGELRESIKTKTFRNNKYMVFGGVVTKGSVNSVTGDKVNVDGFYAKFIEYGFTHVAWPEKGKRIDKGQYSDSRLTEVNPEPFLRPSWDETKNNVKTETIKLSEKSVKAYLKKVKKN